MRIILWPLRVLLNGALMLLVLILLGTIFILAILGDVWAGIRRLFSRR